MRVHHEKERRSVRERHSQSFSRLLREDLSHRPGEVEMLRLQLEPSRKRETSRLCLRACAPTSVRVGATLSLNYARTQKVHRSPARKQFLIIAAFVKGLLVAFTNTGAPFITGRRCEASARLRSDTQLLALRLGDRGDLELVIYDSSEMEGPATHVETLQGGEIYDNSL